MLRRSKCIGVFIAILCTIQANAQISYGGYPRTINEKSTKKIIPIIELQKVNHNFYYEEDMKGTGKGSPMRVGIMQKTSISNLHDGVVDTLINGDRIWRMEIVSEGATFLFPCFKKYDIPEGAELYVYDKNHHYVLGKFTSLNVLNDGSFNTQAIPGDHLILEYYEPASVAGTGVLEIDEIGHGYKDMFDLFKEEKGYHGSSEGNCHINVVCPEGDPWRDQIRSVVHYQMVVGGYIYMCSGALINNTNRDKTNYILSAYHCQEDKNVTRWIFYFNYQTNECLRNTGTYNQSVVGASIVAKNDKSDFLLLKLSGAIPESYNVYYSGWDKSNTTPSVGSCIHHPGGDWKKISIPSSVGNMNSYYWKVNWISGNNNKGVTEEGSSGSPLFNASKRIVGQLQGGLSACDRINTPDILYDIYGKLSSSWNGGGTESTWLSTWLDPKKTGVTYIDGMNWDENPLGIAQQETINDNFMIYPNPSKGVFYVDIDEIGVAEYSIYDMMGRCVEKSKITLTSSSYQLKVNTSLNGGTYLLEININGRKYQKTIVLK